MYEVTCLKHISDYSCHRTFQKDLKPIMWTDTADTATDFCCCRLPFQIFSKVTSHQKRQVIHNQWSSLGFLTKTRHVSSMIHSARPTASPVANIVFAWNLLKKWGRTDGRLVQKQRSLHDCGSASWIN